VGRESGSHQSAATAIRIERIYRATPEEIWNLWTSAEGIESWWAPEGFRCDVRKLDLRVGGELLYALTATGPEQVEFMKQAGMPLSTEAKKNFTDIERPKRLAYVSLIDFVPGVEPYEQLTVIELTPKVDGTQVVMIADPLHDEEWTQRLIAGRSNELDNLSTVIEGRRKG
jgi:uncharacterized protein YndB with AHSA1/START domain